MRSYSPHNIEKEHQTMCIQLESLRPSDLVPNDNIVGEQISHVDGIDPRYNTSNVPSSSTTMIPKSPLLKSGQQQGQHQQIQEAKHSCEFTCQPDDYKGPKIWRNLVRNWPIISQPLAILVILLLLWIMAYSLVPKYAIPNTTIMRIVFLFVGAQISGNLAALIFLPDMLGMLSFGVLYTNLGWADFSGYSELEAFLRNLALINIMLLAGFGLDGKSFKMLWVIIVQLTLVPTIVEVAVICVLAYFLLNMPWLWGLVLGLVITAVSPNVVVTVMLKLKEQKLGLNKGIHTLIYAMTTCNDVVSIFLFGVILGVIFNPGNLSDKILQGPVGIVVGIVYGYLFGLTLVYLPSRSSKYVNGLRFIMTVLGGCIAVIGSNAIGYPSAGALGCVTVAFVARSLWLAKQQGSENFKVTMRLDLMWKFLKPVSFALIGKEIHFSVLDAKIVGYGVILIIVGSLFRLAASYLSTTKSQLDVKERCYVMISGLPKATVQATLGPIALDMARQLNSGQEILSLASSVLVISVIAIIFTAPLGAILMVRLAPIWLKHGDDTNVAVMTSTSTVDCISSSTQLYDSIAVVPIGDRRTMTDLAHTNNAFYQHRGDR